MNELKYAKHERLWLKTDSPFNENWLQELIADDPTILGLGQLELLQSERTQDRAGRLDLLLVDPQKNRRYEVEIMLGAADPSHIMRCIEYWDIERRRYPFYDHVAVLVAEDITGRYLNLLGLFAGSIPLIVIQLNALKIGEHIVLDFVQVLNQTSLRRDDTTQATPRGSTREAWLTYAGEMILGLIDQMLLMTNEKATVKLQLNYLKQYIGLKDGARSRNFIYFVPRTKFVYLQVMEDIGESWPARLEEAGIPVTQDGSKLQITIEPDGFAKQEVIIRELLHAAVASYEA
ncbi:hypothetical protein [Schlesneria paludicola]|uniref:hypothetical protein n=1 Tax=Schlesneria paludicola TaxID=360056 RepID=UPI00029A7717|nr:hypothetical protein [Schlesneria paludicola]